ncbi:MAG TPA: N-acetyltransferase [Dongiaceae bacterium]|nr:N-acetyltransferase [Dongiaceae bacterium]
MEIRPERPEDIADIRYITEAAFLPMAHSNQAEAEIIDALRAADALTISLVAIEDEELIGHVAFSPVTINGQSDGWYGLGPVAVRPDSQRQGVGTALIRKGLGRLEALGAQGCVLLGDPDYYMRFGFETVPGLELPGVAPEYFQCLTFGGRKPPRGSVAFHPAFDVA